MIKSQIIKIDSSKGNVYYNEYKTSFKSVFDAINCDDGEYIQYNLISINIPYSFYSVNNSNNALDMMETCHGITTNRTIFMEIGNYSSNEYCKKLVEELNSVNQILYTINYLRISNRYNISVTNGTSIFKFKSGGNSKRSLHNFIGFPGDEDITINSNTSIISTHCIIMNTVNYIQLKTDLGTQTMLMTDSTDSILEIININCAPYSMINHTPINQTKYAYSNRTINNINIALLDNNGNDLDLNNVNFFMTFNIEICADESYNINDPRHHKTNMQMFYEDSNLLDKQIITEPLNSIEYQNYQNYIMLKKYIDSFNRKKKSNKNNIENGKKEGEQIKKIT